jgi:hypothetical protein
MPTANVDIQRYEALRSTFVIASESGRSSIPEQDEDARGHSAPDSTFPVYDERTSGRFGPYSAGVGSGGGLAGGGVAAEALALVALFSTIRTAMIEPS